MSIPRLASSMPPAMLSCTPLQHATHQAIEHANKYGIERAIVHAFGACHRVWDRAYHQRILSSMPATVKPANCWGVRRCLCIHPCMNIDPCVHGGSRRLPASWISTQMHTHVCLHACMRAMDRLFARFHCSTIADHTRSNISSRISKSGSIYQTRGSCYLARLLMTCT